MNDSYGSNLREAMKRSMGQPAGFKPLNHRQLTFWDRHSETIGLALWVVAVLLICALAWIGLSGAEAHFRVP